MRTLSSLGRRTRTLATCYLPLLSAACGAAGGDPAGPTAGPAPAISVAGPPAAALTVGPGGSATVTVTVSRGGGFGGAIDLAVSDLPAGITATLAPGTLASGVTQSAVTTTVGTGVAPGRYAFTVTASGAGVREVRATVPVTVAPGSAPAAALAATAPAAVSAAPGAGVAAAVVFTRIHFAGDVTLSLDAPPAGISAADVTVPGDASSASLALNVATTAAAGAHALTVRLSGPGGRPAATVALPLTVTAAPEPPAPGGAMDGIYLGFRTNFDGKQYQDYWTFLPNGRVMQAGPYEGLDRPADLAFMCRRHACGTYTRGGSELRVRWAEGADEKAYDVDAQGAFAERGKTQRYRPLAPLTGLRLDATFAVLDQERDSAIVRIRFTADGGFAEERLMHYTAWAQLGAAGEDRVALPGGAGRYAITRNTLALLYDGGRAAYFTVAVPPGEIGKPVPDVIYVNQARIPRVP